LLDLDSRLVLVERLARLREDGALTDDEFAAAKSSVLSAGSTSSGAYRLENLPRADGSAGRIAGVGAVVVLVIAAVSYLVLGPSSVSAPVPSRAPETSVAAGPDPAQATSDADAALESASAAVQAAADDVAGASSQDADYEQGASSAEEPAAPVALSTKAARCRVHVPGQDGLTGACTFKTFSDTEFEVGAPSVNYSAQVIRQADGHHGIVVGSDGAKTDVGLLVQKGACWSNAAAEICAWAV
jgi:hypothetical protein